MSQMREFVESVMLPMQSAIDAQVRTSEHTVSMYESIDVCRALESHLASLRKQRDESLVEENRHFWSREITRVEQLLAKFRHPLIWRGTPPTVDEICESLAAPAANSVPRGVDVGI